MDHLIVIVVNQIILNIHEIFSFNFDIEALKTSWNARK